MIRRVRQITEIDGLPLVQHAEKGILNQIRGNSGGNISDDESITGSIQITNTK